MKTGYVYHEGKDIFWSQSSIYTRLHAKPPFITNIKDLIGLNSVFLKPFFIATPEEIERQLTENGRYRWASTDPAPGYIPHPMFRQLTNS